jgi:hypothetical protein
VIQSRPKSSTSIKNQPAVKLNSGKGLAVNVIFDSSKYTRQGVLKKKPGPKPRLRSPNGTTLVLKNKVKDFAEDHNKVQKKETGKSFQDLVRPEPPAARKPSTKFET